MSVYKKHYGREVRVYYLMMAPFGVLFVIFVLVPVISSIALSLSDFNMAQWPRFSGLDNFLRMFMDDSVFMIALKNTMIFALFTGPVSYFLCLIFAWLVNELGNKLRTLFTFLLYIPSMSGAVYVIWAYIFSGDQYGLLNSFLMNFGWIKEPSQWLTDPKTIMVVVIVVQLWLSLGTAFLSFIAGFKGIDPQQYEAGAIDGISNRLQELWHITLPNMGPQLLFGAVMQIGASFAAGAVGTELLKAAGAGEEGIATDYAASTMTTYMAELGTTRYEMGYACAIAVFLFVMMVVFNGVIRKALRRFVD
jgi:multiple sugar transport system permease protein